MKKLTLNSMLISLAVVLSYAERFIPLDIIIPLPGIKLGFANIVTMFALFFLGIPSAVTVTVLRCVLASLLFGGMSSLLYSLSGAFLALAVMILLKLGYNRIFSLLGISMGGAAAHNTGQIIMASLMMKNTAIFSYLPFLLLAGLGTGLLTAIITVNLFRIIEKTNSVKLS
ncbi:MAG: Gx transporter family protein [Clostridiaceae bacterium]|jgi:heptaprenyl diphosphate synthase|nr:Gx transporter family protein [Clostridiaceae bacterium]